MPSTKLGSPRRTLPTIRFRRCSRRMAHSDTILRRVNVKNGDLVVRMILTNLHELLRAGYSFSPFLCKIIRRASGRLRVQIPLVPCSTCLTFSFLFLLSFCSPLPSFDACAYLGPPPGGRGSRNCTQFQHRFRLAFVLTSDPFLADFWIHFDVCLLKLYFFASFVSQSYWHLFL